MACQQLQKSVEEEIREYIESKSLNEIYPAVDQSLSMVDEKLYNASSAVEMSRKELYCHRHALADSNAACEDAQQKLRDCARAYKTIHERYGKVSTDFQNAAVLNASLRQDLEKANETIYMLELEAREYKLHLGNSGKSASANSDKATETEWNTERFISREHHDAQILELEQGIAKAILEHEKEKGKMMEEHKNALRNAADRIIANQQKIEELEMLCKPRPEGIHLGTPEQILSPKRGKPGEGDKVPEVQVRQAKKGRKRR